MTQFDQEALLLRRRLYPPMSRAEFIAKASDLFGKDPLIVASNRRFRDLCEVRQAISFVLYNYNHAGITEIGRLLHRDHTTISHAIQEAEKKIERSKAFRAKVRTMRGWLCS